MLNKKLEKNFDHRVFEKKHYARWEQSGGFARQGDGKPFTIVLPPPNVTGSLHVGHALNHTLQDILIRYHRMRGDQTLWQPGTDHAGIATQMMVERDLARQGLDRKEIGREAFIERVWAWKAKYGGAIVDQQRQLGESCDWSRQRFTMDEGLSRAVTRVFVTLHRQKLIYRDKRLVNWDPQLQTALSDLEVENPSVRGTLYHIRYPLVDDSEGSGIVVATTRPETLFGDVAVAVHPDDPRYRSLVGRKCRLPLSGREIPIIADPYADPEQGSGAVKITPAHDFNDFEVGRSHGLSQISVIDRHGRLNDSVPEDFVGLDRFVARKQLVDALEAQGLLVAAEDHLHTVPHGDRSKVPLEPLLTDQWYLDASVLAGPAVQAVEDGRITILPITERNRYYGWMREIRPWCISRQLWWGHRIPAWYDPDGRIFVAETREEAEAEARAHHGKAVVLTRDSDVLDTWFSSALWPFSTLGWPDQDDSVLQTHYPTDVLVTGSDILFFWVARMVWMGLPFLDDVPFHTVVLHGLLRDEQGRKMSKTLGNVIDPLELSAAKGTDALRLTLCALTNLGRDTRISEQRFEGYRNFVTKLWNAARLLEHHGVCLQDTAPSGVAAPHNLWILAELNQTIVRVDQALADYRFGDYAASLYRLVWSRFCDWSLELAKPILHDSAHPDRAETVGCLGYCFGTILRLLHPITPFVTEELHEALSSASIERAEEMLILARWPEAQPSEPVPEVEGLIDLLTTVRSIKASMDLAPATTVALNPGELSESGGRCLERYAGAVKQMAGLSLDHAAFTTRLRFPFAGRLVHLHLDGTVDLASVKGRLEKERLKALKQADQIARRLANPDFCARAPEDVLEENRTRADRLRESLSQYDALLEGLSV